jgi:hypothetical protein
LFCAAWFFFLERSKQDEKISQLLTFLLPCAEDLSGAKFEQQHQF